ncbi:MAG: hypothetical protein ACKVQC_04550, partial [Elusimicrobiota bacterium]
MRKMKRNFVSFFLKTFLVFISLISLLNKNSFATTEGHLISAGGDVRVTISSFTGTTWDTGYKGAETAPGSEPNKGVITHVVVKSAPSGGDRPNEKIMVTLDSQCRLVAQVWDGTQWGNVQSLTDDFTDTDKSNFGFGIYRFFDVAYSSNAATIFFPHPTNTLGTNHMQFVTWDGASWSGATTWGTNDAGRIYWVRAEKCPLVSRSTEVAVVTIDANNDISGATFNGSAFANTRTFTSTAEYSTLRNFDIAYEQLSGDLYVWYGIDGNTTPQGDLWNGSAWSTPAAADGSNMGVDSSWFRAVPQAGTDRIGLIIQETGASYDISGAVWDGAAFVNWTDNLETNLTAVLHQGAMFDGAWTTQLSSFVVCYVEAALTNSVRCNQWTGSGWSGEPVVIPAVDSNISNYDGIIITSTGTSTNEIQMAVVARESYAATAAGVRREPALYIGSYNASARTLGTFSKQSNQITFDYYRPFAFDRNLLVYAEYTGRPNIKQYGFSGYSTETNPGSEVPGAIRYSVIKASPRRDEKLMAVLDSSGTLTAYSWRSGSGWSSGSQIATGLGAGGASDFNFSRSFDISYENASGEALLVYTKVGSSPPKYRIWDPSGSGSWSAEQDAPGTGGQVGTPWWITTESNPGFSSNEIVVLTLDNQASPDIFGYVWDGSAFGNIQQITSSAERAGGANVPRYQPFDVVYESTNSRAMVVWAEDNNDTFRYAFWVSSATTWDVPAGPGYAGRDVDSLATTRIYQIKLTAQPNSNNIAMAAATNLSDLYVNVWWSTSTTWGTTSSGGQVSRLWASLRDVTNKGSFDIAWEGNGDQVVAFAADNSATNLRNAWWRVGASTWTVPGTVPDTQGIPENIKAYADPYSDNINIYVDTYYGNMLGFTWDGDPWSVSPAANYLGSSMLRRTFNILYGFEPVSFAWSRDVTAPTSAIQVPAHLGQYNSLIILSGIHSDGSTNNSGTSIVQLRLKRATDNNYWTGAAWSGSDTWFSASLHTSSWTYTVSYPTATWTDARDYTINVRAQDIQGNLATTFSTFTFSYDISAPTATVTSHSEGQYVNSAPTISGTSVDNYVGVTSVEISIRRDTIPNAWWDPTLPGWTTVSEYWITASSTASNPTPWDTWAYNTLSAGLTFSNTSYYVRVRGKDGTGSYQTNPTTFTFIYDNAIPTIGIIAPDTAAPSWLSSLTTISGTASDNFGLRTSTGIEIRIYDEIGATYISTGTNNWTPLNGSTSWSFTSPTWTNNIRYRIEARAYDRASNVSTAYSTATFTYDVYQASPERPNSVVTGPIDGGYINSLSNITGTAQDNNQGGIDVVEYALKDLTSNQWWNNSAGLFNSMSEHWNNTTETIAGNPSITWTTTLSDDSQLVTGRDYAIYSRANDKVTPDPGNYEVTFTTNTFMWDVVRPTTSITVPGTGGFPPSSYLTGSATFYGGYYDGASGVVTNPTCLNRNDNTLTTSRIEYLLSNQSVNPAQYWKPDYDASQNPLWTGAWVTTIPTDWPDVCVFASSWSVPTPDMSSFNGNYFLLVTRAQDRATNVQNSFTVGVASNSFTVDVQAPDARITVPLQSYRNSLPTISATASDNVQSVSLVEVQISSKSAGSCPGDASCRYWTGTAWSSVESWVPASPAGGSNWQHTVSTSIGFVDARDYTVKVRATDGSGNTGNTAPGADQTKTFTWDVTTPTTLLDKRNGGAASSLANNSAYNSITSLGGTAADTSPGLVQLVDMYIKQGDVVGDGSGLYWDGSSFNAVGSPTWFSSLFATPNFSTATPSIPWTNGQVYWFRSRSQDFASNQEGSGTGGSIIKVNYDTERPVSRITNVTNASFINGLTTLSGTSSDVGTGPNPGRAENVYVHVYRPAPSDLTYNWNTSSWVSGDNGAAVSDPALSVYWTTAAYSPYVALGASGTWTRAMPSLIGLSGNSFRLVVRAKDWATNIEVVPSTITFTLDEYQVGPPERPRGVITYPTDDLHTISTFPYTTGNGEDNVGGQLTSIGVMIRRFNNDGSTNYWNGFSWAGAEPGSWPASTADDGSFNSNSEAFTFAMPPLADWTDDTRYDVRARAFDAGGNQTLVQFSTKTFTYDVIRPDTRITFPVNSGYISQIGNISGTASDTGAGVVDRIETRVRRYSDNKYLDITGGLPGSWVTDITSNTWNYEVPSGTGPWTWSLSTAAWTTGETYEASSRARDKSLKYDLSYSTVVFSADFVAPISKVVSPSHGGSPSSINTISGTASDGAGISSVYVAYYRQSTDRWWNKITGDFDLNAGGTIPPDSPSGGSSYWVSASTIPGSPVTWYTIGTSTPTFPAAGTYDILSSAIDIASNIEARPTSAGANTNRISFSYTPPIPESRIQRPDNTTPHFRASLAAVSGTANSVATGVSFRMKDITISASHLTWNGTAFVSTVTFNGFVGSTYTFPTWSYTVPASSFTNLGKYQIESQALGSPNESPFQGPNEFYIDDTNPTAAVLMPDVDYKKTLPTLSGTAADNADGLTGAQKTVYFRLRRTVPSTQYWVSISSSWVADGGVNCLSAIDDSCLTATSGGGNNYSITHSSFTDLQAFEAGKAYTVSIVVRDRATNGTTVNKTFTWDTTSPTSGITRPSGSSPVNSLPTLSGTASDNFQVLAASVSLQSLKNDKCFDPGTNFFTANCPYWIDTSTDGSANWQYSNANINVRLGESNTWYVMLSKVKDVATNEQSGFSAGVSSVAFIADTQVPIVGVTFPAHNGNYKGTQVGGGGSPLTGTVSDPNSPWNSGIRRVQTRVSYLLANDTWYWQPADIKFSSGAAVSASGWFNAANTDWEYFGSFTWNASDTQYRLEARSEDASFLADGAATGNTSVPSGVGSDIVDFIIDDTPPTVGIVTPSSAFLQNLTLISGTANATLSGLNNLQIRISTGVGSPYYWTGSSWTTTVTWLNTILDSQTVWHYDVSSFMVADTTYTVSARALDNAGNYSTVFSTRIFTVDLTTPTAAITYPVNGNVYSAVQVSTPIAGTASDAGSFASQLSTVTISLRDLTDVDDFNGTAFAGGGPFNLGANGGVITSWQYNSGNLVLENDHQYRLTARAVDNAGNSVTTSNVTFQYDVEIPTSSITSPVAGYVTSLTSIAGTASDERFGARNYEAKLGTYTIGVAFYDSVAIKWWDGSSFDGAGPTYFEVVNTTTAFPNTWSYSVPGALQSALIDGRTYRIVPRAVDLAANAEFASSTAPAGIGINVIYDPNAPAVSIVTPNDATPADDNSPRLSTMSILSGNPYFGGSTADGTGTGVNLVQVRIYKSDPARYWTFGIDYSVSAYTIDTSLADTAWFTATTTNSFANWYTTFTFLTDYKYHLEVRARDQAGNYSTTFATASFIFDQNIPQSGITLPVNGSIIKSFTQIEGTMSETGVRYLGTVSPVKLAIKENTSGLWWDDLAGTFSLAGPPTTDNVTLYSSSWAFTGIVQGDLTSGVSYYMTSRAYDNAAPVNNETFYSVRSATFTFDNTAPVVVLNSPSDGIFFNNSTALISSGTAIDATSGVQTVQVNINNGSQYWSGTHNAAGNFTGSVNYVTADFSGNPNWIFTIPIAQLNEDFVHNTTYYVQARAWDIAGTTSAFTAVKTIVYDVGSPTSTVTSPVNYINASQTVISGTAIDNPARVATVQLAISSSASGSNGTWYNGTGFTANFGDGGTYRSTILTQNGAGAGIDLWTFSRPTLEQGKTYLVRLITTDTAGNVRTQTIGESVTLIYDENDPTAFIQDPNQAYEKSLPTISGTSQDSNTAITQVQVAISTGTSAPYTDQFWNGSSWVAGPSITWLSASATDGSFNSTSEDWYFTGSTPTWVNNKIYKVHVRPVDSAGNNTTVVVSTFTYDNTPAVSAVVVPSNLSAYRALALVTGTMSDSPNPAPQTVEIALRHPNATFWDGATFIGDDLNPVWLSAASVFGSSWTFTNLPSSWDDRTIYKLFVRAIDLANNSVANPDFANTGRQFRIDYSSPVSKVSSLSTVTTNYVNGPISSVSGTASDLAGGAGINTVNIRVLRSDGNYLNAAENGFNGASSNFPLTTTNGTSWSKTFSDPPSAIFEDGYAYTIQSRATDLSSPTNTEQTFTSAYFVVDQSSPTSAVVSAQGGYFNNSLTTLSGTLADAGTAPGNIASSVQYIDLKIFDGSEMGNPWWDGTSWVAGTISTRAVVYSSTWVYNNVPGDWSHGTGVDSRWYQFHVRAVDYAGNTQSYAIITSTYDVRPGTAVILTPNTAIVSALPTISGTATDSVFGTNSLANVEISIQRDSDNRWFRFSDDTWNPSGSNIWNSVDSYNGGNGNWNIDTSAPGIWENLVGYGIYVRALDKAGNYQSSQVYPSTFSFVFQPPASVVAINKPIANKFYRLNLSEITGTANAATTVVEVQIESLSAPVNKYWSSVSQTWVAASTYTRANALAVPNWTWNSSVPASGDWYIHAASFTVRARGVNTATLTGAQVSQTFGFDTQAPDVFISQPLTAFTSYFAQILGTANDQVNLAGINNVEIDIQRTNKADTTAADDYYWDGSTFTLTRPNLSSNISLASPNLWNWNYTIAYSTMIQNGYKYKIYYLAQDDAYHSGTNTIDGNQSGEQTLTVVYDITIPTATITAVTNGSVRSSVSIASGPVTDLLGAGQNLSAQGLGQVSDVYLRLKRNSNGSFWSGADWQAGPTPIDLNATLHISSWSYSSLPDFSQAIYNKETFTLMVSAKDRAQNLNNLYVSGTSSVTFTVDNQPPSISISLPTSNAIRRQLLNIAGSVDDNTSTDYPYNAGINATSNVDVVVYTVISATTYYWNGTVFSSATTEGASWKTVDSYTGLGASSGTWTYNALDNLKMDPPTVMNGWITDRAYTVKARARDNALPTPNLGSETVSFNVVIDTTPPVSGVTRPNSSPIASLATISATANADLGGFGNIKFSIRDHDNNYFNGSSFVSVSEVYIDTKTFTGQTGNVVYTSTFVTSGNLISGSTYTIRIFGTDAALPTANTQVGGTPGSYSFLFDNTVPETLTISVPVNNGSYGPAQTLTSFTGTSVDNHSGMNRLELELYNVTDSFYWGGTSFNQVSSTWVSISTPFASWSYSAPTWLVNKNYQLRVRAIDLAGNVSTSSVVSFIYDSTSPIVSSILNPSQLYQAGGTLTVLSGTANDGLANPRSGLQIISVAIFDADDGDSDKWYSGTNAAGFNQTVASWRTTSSTITLASSSAPWSYPFGADQIPSWENGHQYELHARARDVSQNMSAVVVSTFVYDPTIPTGVITKPFDDPGADYESSLNTISGTAADTTGGPRSGVISQVQIRLRHIGGNVWWDLAEPGGPNWDSDASLNDNTAWIAASSTNSFTNWYFTGSTPTWVSGQSYGVSLRVQDSAGNYSTVSYSTFTFDTNLPQSVVTNPSPGSVVNSLNVSGILGTAADTGSPVVSMRVAIKKLDDGLWWNAIDDDFTSASGSPLFRSGVTFVAPDWNYPTASLGNDDLVSGTSYYITSEATDSAGNVENDFATGASTFTFDNTSPVTGVTRPLSGGVIYSAEPYYSSLATLSGTADDISTLPLAHNLNAGIGSTGVKVSIYNQDTGFYWAQGAANFSEADISSSFVNATFTGTSSGTWSYAGTGFNAALTHGHTYVVRSSATDLISNVQVVISSQVFVFDSSAPIVSLVLPAHSVSRNSLTQITGTARDYPIVLKRVGMSSIQLQIIDLGNNHAIGGSGANQDTYWDGVSTFTTTSSTVSISISGQGAVTWSYDNPDDMLQSGHTYRMVATALDALNNTSQQSVSQFVFDSSAPVSNVTRPQEGIGYNGTTNTLLTISATSDDLPSSPLASVGVDPTKVKITVRRDDNNNNVSDVGDLYWDGEYPGAFDEVGEVIKVLNFDGGNIFSTAAPTWVSGYRYFMEIWAEDNLGNAESRTTRRFTVDNLPPTSAVTVPTDNASLQSLATVSGTASDITSSIAGVNVTLRDLGPNLVVGGGDDLYWSSLSGWINTSTQITANLIDVYTTSATWNLTTAGNKLPGSWPSGRIFNLIPQARDSAENIQNVFSTSTFKIDNTPPIAGIIQPAHNSGFNSLSTISGTAEGTEVAPNLDFSTIQAVYLQVINISTSPVKYWNGSLFTTSVSTRTAVFTGVSSGTWVYEDASINSQFVSGNQYLVLAWGVDSAGNTQSVFTVGISSNVFFYDNVPAVAAISIPQHQKPYNTFTSFNGTATDDFSGVNQVNLTISYISSGNTYYWNGAAFSSSTYVTVPSSVVPQNATSVSWSYNTASILPLLVNGTQYSIFARAGDRSSNFEATGSTNTFLFDIAYGTAVITTPQGVGVYHSPANPLPTISGTAVDAPVHAFSGVLRDEVRIRRDPPGNEFWNGSAWVVNSSTWLVTTGTTSWSITAPAWADDTEYILNARTLDLA